MKKVYLSLGSNLGDRKANLRRAIELLEQAGIRVLAESAVYETEPQDVKTQPWFLNLVIAAETRLFPMQVLARIHRIERALGRTRTRPKGPRTIDIDILLYGEAVVDTAGLQIPHPRLSERRFVIEPLNEIAPNLRHPVTRRTIREMLPATASQIVNRIS